MKNNLKTSAKGIKLISQREANILHWYLDSSGYPTIGVGHLIKKGDPWKKGSTITMAESLALLKDDLAEAENAVNHFIKQPMSQNEFDAMVSLTFNIGTGGFAKSSVVRLFNIGNVDGAANAFLKWNKSGGGVVPGLVNRRRAERLQFLQDTAHVIIASPKPIEGEPSHPIIEAVQELPPPTIEEGHGLVEDGSFFGKGKTQLDAVLNAGTGVAQRADSAKSIWATIGGSIVQAFWAVFAFIIGLPKELWITVAVISGVLVIMYLYRQNKLGFIREWAGHKLLGDTKQTININPPVEPANPEV